MPRERDLRDELEDYDCCEAEGAAGFVEKALAILGEQPSVSEDVLSDIGSALASHLCDEEPGRQLVAAGLGQLLCTFVGGWPVRAAAERCGWVGRCPGAGRSEWQPLGLQPAASSQQPAASSQQPAASSQQPAASSQQPAASSQHNWSSQRRRALGLPPWLRFEPPAQHSSPTGACCSSPPWPLQPPQPTQPSLCHSHAPQTWQSCRQRITRTTWRRG